ncbi:MAG: ribonuclease HI family protein [Leptospiraceae bacterium]|nr:ribonuclease HI family protein [Leptospiraceae bacterium]
MIKIFCDGASKGNPGPASIGVWATNDKGSGNDGESVFEISEAIGNTTNNMAEWKSLLRAVEVALEKNHNQVQIFMDSELVVKQVLGKYKVKKPEFIPFWKQIQENKKKFSSFSIQHVFREQNKMADLLANQALL